MERTYLSNEEIDLVISYTQRLKENDNFNLTDYQKRYIKLLCSGKNIISIKSRNIGYSDLMIDALIAVAIVNKNKDYKICFISPNYDSKNYAFGQFNKKILKLQTNNLFENTKISFSSNYVKKYIQINNAYIKLCSAANFNKENDLFFVNSNRFDLCFF